MHDFKKFPELRNNQMNELYFQSPHKQITEDFIGKVVKVIDGDTIKVSTNFRSFLTTIRLANIAAAELSENGGEESKRKLTDLIEGEEVNIIVNPKNRVGKWGRIIGEILSNGMNINEEMIRNNFAVDFEDKKQSVFFSFDKIMESFSL